MGLIEGIKGAAKGVADRIAEAANDNKNPEAAKSEENKPKGPDTPAPVKDAATGEEHIPEGPVTNQNKTRKSAAIANGEEGKNNLTEDKKDVAAARQDAVDSKRSGGDTAGADADQADLDADVEQANLQVELAIQDGEDGTITAEEERDGESVNRGYEDADAEGRGLKHVRDMTDGERVLTAEALEEEQESFEDAVDLQLEGLEILDEERPGGGPAYNLSELSVEERVMLYQNVESQRALLTREDAVLNGTGAVEEDGTPVAPVDAAAASSETGVEITEADLAAHNEEIQADLARLDTLDDYIASSFTPEDLEALNALTTIETTNEDGSTGVSYDVNPELKARIAEHAEEVNGAGSTGTGGTDPAGGGDPTQWEPGRTVEVDGVTATAGETPGSWQVTVPPGSATTVTPGVNGQSEGQQSALVPGPETTALTPENSAGWTQPYFSTNPETKQSVLGNPTDQPVTFTIQVDLGMGEPGEDGTQESVVTSAAVTNADEVGASETTTNEDGTPAAEQPAEPQPIDYNDGTHDQEVLNAAVFFGVIDPAARDHVSFGPGGELVYNVQGGEGYWQAQERVLQQPPGTTFAQNWSETWSSNAERLGRTGANSDLVFTGEPIVLAGWTRDSLATGFVDAGILPATSEPEEPAEPTTYDSEPVPDAVPNDPDAIRNDPRYAAVRDALPQPPSGNIEEDLRATGVVYTTADGTEITGDQLAEMIYNSPGTDADPTRQWAVASEDVTNQFENGEPRPRQNMVDDLAMLNAMYFTGHALAASYGAEAYVQGTSEPFADSISNLNADLERMHTDIESARTFLEENPELGTDVPPAGTTGTGGASATGDIPPSPSADDRVELAVVGTPGESFAAQTFPLADGSEVAGNHQETPEVPPLAAAIFGDPTVTDPLTRAASGYVESTVDGGDRPTSVVQLSFLDQMYVWGNSLAAAYEEQGGYDAELAQLEADLATMKTQVDEYRQYLIDNPTYGEVPA